jgi:acyl carrier protein
VITEEDFLHLVRDELALPLGGGPEDSLDRGLHWDSLTVLKLVAEVERRTGNRVPVGRLVRSRDLRTVYNAFAAAGAAS